MKYADARGRVRRVIGDRDTSSLQKIAIGIDGRESHVGPDAGDDGVGVVVIGLDPVELRIERAVAVEIGVHEDPSHPRFRGVQLAITIAVFPGGAADRTGQRRMAEVDFRGWCPEAHGDPVRPLALATLSPPRAEAPNGNVRRRSKVPARLYTSTPEEPEPSLT